MRRRAVVSGVVLGLALAGAWPVAAGPLVAPATQRALREAKAEQQKCPVMGNPINKKYSTKYKGKVYYFCCASCIDTFNKDPEKYAKKK